MTWVISTMGDRRETTAQGSEGQPSELQNKEAEQRAKQKEQKEANAVLTELSERLFEYAMKDQWQEVVKIYEKKPHPECHEAKITEAEDTALHLAVSGGKLEVVRQLLDYLGDNASNVLKAKNKRGYTPLHIAAALGNVRMCNCMASKDYNLIAEKNEKKETPVYLAARFGHKDAFLCLYFCCKGNHSDICCRDESGNTILHAAIGGEHFDLAFQIICKYPELVNAINADGLSPLHILATKTNAFKSGSHLGFFDRILYRCVVVDEEKEEEFTNENKNYYLERFEEMGPSPSLPQNYGTCVRFFRMFWGVVFYGMPLTSPGPKQKVKEGRGDVTEDHLQLPAKFVMKVVSGLGSRFLSYFKRKKNTEGIMNIVIIDEENPRGTDQDESSSSQSKSESNNNSHGAAKESSGNTDPGSSAGTGQKPEEDREGYLPANYATFIRFFKFVVKFVLVVLGLGFQRIRRITTKKQRHTWATQVMNKLIEKASTYKYFGGQTGNTGIGEITSDIPRNLSQMSSSLINDASTGYVMESSSYNQGESQTKTDSNKNGGNSEMVEKFLSEYNITGTLASKTLKHALKMEFQKKVAQESTRPKTPILIAASNGITEMVKKILGKFPVAIQDVDDENKNVMLLAVENRQTHTFQFLIEKQSLHDRVFRQWDNQGNNALHLAATYGHYRPWLIPGSALQMQWELKWYKFVKKSLAKHLLVHYNNKGQTPKQIFTETHKVLVKDGSEWLTKTSESCSLIAALIATVAFATAANIPGGVEKGKPVLRYEAAFEVFAISSLIALCFSLTALVFFLAILTSRFEEKDFAMKLPRKLILGLTSLFTSIAAMLVSFCAGHFFELRDELKFAAFPIYTATCLPISFFAVAQLPLYFDLLWAICKRVPQSGYKEFVA